ncbi:hypothetical protein [Cytobacillus oceanisediminis]|uniref:hypothetical protein n=1 Tax=Cytobacillus oceanisediminis TaxID=665099 RepID=UPI001FB30E39|nr:hypothetical protein [Cytobacillus oceanisediminis]UOE55908.1 hypothetical protein IRB79_03640 [Cytobacillus oceanisediminis]
MSETANSSSGQSNPTCSVNNNPPNTNTFNPIINITTAGIAGPLTTANNALIGLNTTTSVQPNTPIPLDTNQLINGSAISHASPSPIINLEPNQTYLVEYSVHGTAPKGSGVNAALRLNQNTIIPFSEATNDFNFVSPTEAPMGATGGAVFNTTGNSLNTLEVLNLAPTGPTTFVSNPPFFRAVSLRIVRLS